MKLNDILTEEQLDELSKLAGVAIGSAVGTLAGAVAGAVATFNPIAADVAAGIGGGIGASVGAKLASGTKAERDSAVKYWTDKIQASNKRWGAKVKSAQSPETKEKYKKEWDKVINGFEKNLDKVNKSFKNAK